MSENSITLTEDQRDAFRIDAELRGHAGKAVEEMIEVGRCLNEINERKLYGYLGAGSLAEYAEKAVGVSERQAYNFIKIYTTYGEEGLKRNGALGMSKLVALAQLNDTDRTEMLESGEAAEISTRQLNERIKELKHENDQLRFDNEALGGKLTTSDELSKNKTAEIARLEAEKAELEKRLAEATAPVVATMTDEEKDEIRREAETKAKMDAVQEIKEAKKEAKEAGKREKELADKLAAIEKTRDELNKKIQEEDLKVKNLQAMNKTLQDEKAALQARAEAEKKPVLAGNKEALKYCLEDVQQQYSRAVEIVGTMEAEEKTKFKAALCGIAEKLKAAAEGIA